MMRCLTLQWIAIGTLAWVGCTSAENPVSGDFLSGKYTAILLATKSPAQAARAPKPQMVSVRTEKNGVVLKTIYGFNEGGPIFKVAPSGSLKVMEGVAQHPAYQSKEAKSLTLGYDGHPQTAFQAVGDAQQYVQSICLAGTYDGTKKERVQFTRTGEYILNGSKHLYTVGLYYPPTFHRDYFLVDSLEYGFERKADTLKIFEVTGGSLFEEGTMDEAPLMVLIRVPG
jgi:hypothetical protein